MDRAVPSVRYLISVLAAPSESEGETYKRRIKIARLCQYTVIDYNVIRKISCIDTAWEKPSVKIEMTGKA